MVLHRPVEPAGSLRKVLSQQTVCVFSNSWASGALRGDLLLDRQGVLWLYRIRSAKNVTQGDRIFFVFAAAFQERNRARLIALIALVEGVKD